MEQTKTVVSETKIYRLHIKTEREDGARGAGWPSVKCFCCDDEAVAEFRKYTEEQFLPTANEIRCTIYEGDENRIVSEFILSNASPNPLKHSL